jgi:hypothetical protein
MWDWLAPLTGLPPLHESEAKLSEMAAWLTVSKRRTLTDGARSVFVQRRTLQGSSLCAER